MLYLIFNYSKYFNIEKENKSKSIKRDFYESLENSYDSLLKNTVLIIVEDLNALIGRESSCRPTIGR